MIETFDGTVQRQAIPAEAFVCQMAGSASFAEEGEDKNNFRLTLYDGAVVSHWFWGNLAFDLSTMKLEKKKIPVLYKHNEYERIGFSTAASFEGKFVLEGEFLENEKAQTVKRDAKKGFPFEGSLFFDRNKSKLEYIKKGEQVEVNGRVLKGPGTLVTNTVIKEGSFCLFGKMENTVTQVYDKTIADKETNMSEKNDPKNKELTVETFGQQYPEIFKTVSDSARAEGEKAEQERFGKFREKFGDDPAFCLEQFAAGVTLTAAVEAQNAKLKKVNAELDVANKAAEEAAKNNAEQKPEANGKEKVTAAQQEFNADGGGGGAASEGADKYAAEYAKDKKLQEEFSSVDIYRAFKQAQEKGLVE